MKNLGELLPDLAADWARLPISGISWDSRRVEPGDLFFALPGRTTDGKRYAADAAARGAVAVAGEEGAPDLQVPYLGVPCARKAMAHAAAAFYGHPSRHLEAIGVTGTNGKTTVVHLLGQLLPGCETLTTVRMEREGLSCVTTPEAPDLQRLLATALKKGRQHFAFEASSIGIVQKRVTGTELAAAVFTGLGRDHLDFHGDEEAYFAAKLQLFALVRRGGVAVVNADDPRADRVRGAFVGTTVDYGLRGGAFTARDLVLGVSSAAFELVTPEGSASVRLPFPGRHNVCNALAAAATAWALGVESDTLLERLSRARLPPGRYSLFRFPTGAQVVVDYAHTPEALEAMLASLRPGARRLVCVFGAPGECDPGKRPLMGRAVGSWADGAIITSDNPKSEDPATIATEIAGGLKATRVEVTIEPDRAAAIRRAVAMVGPGDTVLVAGKGHERVQLTRDGPVPHCDLDVIRTLSWSLGRSVSRSPT